MSAVSRRRLGWPALKRRSAVSNSPTSVRRRLARCSVGTAGPMMRASVWLRTPPDRPTASQSRPCVCSLAPWIRRNVFT
nr:hypothetical protein [Human alphaherpesvirus 2]QBH85185.1 hypothetical protein [Human alphaherpesvirus 2]QBH85339.1 hypothetical protein [Human alphaherpesvirus 2]